MPNQPSSLYALLFFSCSIFANNAVPNIADIINNIEPNNNTERKLLLEQQKLNLQKKIETNETNVILSIGEIMFGLAFIPIKFARLISAVALCDGARRLYNHNFYNWQNNEKYRCKIEKIDLELTLLTNKTNEENTHD